MKLIKPIIFAIAGSSFDFVYRLVRHLKPDIWFVLISFLVFFIIFFVLLSDPKD